MIYIPSYFWIQLKSGLNFKVRKNLMLTQQPLSLFKHMTGVHPFPETGISWPVNVKALGLSQSPFAAVTLPLGASRTAQMVIKYPRLGPCQFPTSIPTHSLIPSTYARALLGCLTDITNCLKSILILCQWKGMSPSQLCHSATHVPFLRAINHCYQCLLCPDSL